MTGWKLVPVEADETMVYDGEANMFEHMAEPRDWTIQATKDAWHIMIVAAPTPPDEVLERMARAHVDAARAARNNSPCTNAEWATFRKAEIAYMRAALREGEGRLVDNKTEVERSLMESEHE